MEQLLVPELCPGIADALRSVSICNSSFVGISTAPRDESSRPVIAAATKRAPGALDVRDRFAHDLQHYFRGSEAACHTN
jgi:hypothetical protein